MPHNNQSLRELFEDFAVERNERRLRLHSLLFGVVWLCFLSGEQQNTDNTGRTLRLSTETEEERAQREEQETRDGHRSRNNPRWIRDAVFCTKKILEMGKSSRGPAVTLKEKFPSPTLQDCPALAMALLDVARANGLENETSTDFRKWICE